MGNHRVKKIILLFGDIGCYYAALFAALTLRVGEIPSLTLWSDHVFVFSVILPFWIIIFYSADFYHISFIRKRGAFYSRVLIVMGIVMAVSAILFYVLDFPAINPKIVLIIHSGIFLLFFFGWRNIATRKMLSATKRLAIFIGDQAHYHDFERRIRMCETAEYLLAGYADPWMSDASRNSIALTVNVVRERIANKTCEALIVQDDRFTETLSLFHVFFVQGGRIQTLSSYIEEQFQELFLEPVESADIAKSIDFGQRKTYDSIKRFFDIIFALIFLGAGTLIIAPVIMAVKLCFRAPVFYRQKRCTKDGKIFTLYKFRTMVLDAETEGPLWAEINDSRVTRFGALLRHTHIDEFPQVLNVLRGELSFVGPRPERPDFVKLLSDSIPYYSLRHRITPGISGWAQINFPYAASVDDARRKLSYDLYYVKHRSFSLDIKIVLKTIAFIVKGQGG